MNQLSEEQRARIQLLVEQLSKPDFVCVCAERFCIHWQVYAVKVLSPLLDRDSQAARVAHRNYECMTTVADETLWCATCAAHAEYLRGRSDAATAMRDKCVEKVKVMGQQWQDQRLRKKRDLMEHAAMMCGAKAEAAYEITRALESLTPDQVKPGEM